MRVLVIAALALLSTSSASAFSPGYSSMAMSRTRTTTTTTTTTSLASAETKQGSSSSSIDESESERESKNTDGDAYNLNPAFAGAYAKAEAGLAAVVTKKELLQPLLHFTKEYIAANQASFTEGGNDIADAPQAVGRILEAIQLGMAYGTGENKFIFGSSHNSMRGKEPDKEDGNEVDFYAFGTNFFKPVIDIQKSVVMGLDNFQKVIDIMNKGENVVFLANHQSEADPQVMSICLDSVDMEHVGERLVYVAGHKVTTDALAIPFSMGRNLICIHSKKHINADPELKSVKQRQNLSAMGGMLDRLKKGGCALWVAPSGGRDRRDLETGKVPPAPFDQKTIDMFRLMGNKSKIPTHFFTLAMVTYDLCPPPDFVEAGVGEQRNVRYVPVGIHCGDELSSEGGLEKRHEFAEAAMKECVANYDALVATMEEKKNNNQE